MSVAGCFPHVLVMLFLLVVVLSVFVFFILLVFCVVLASRYCIVFLNISVYAVHFYYGEYFAFLCVFMSVSTDEFLQKPMGLLVFKIKLKHPTQINFKCLCDVSVPLS